jgi:hypothetical protein
LFSHLCSPFKYLFNTTGCPTCRRRRLQGSYL